MSEKSCNFAARYANCCFRDYFDVFNFDTCYSIMELGNINTIYFLGIGGIGMSALARYFAAKGYRVLGYDRTSSALTQELQNEGIIVEYGDDCSLVETLKNNETLVVRTPAVPADQPQFVWLSAHDFTIMKRAAVLGWLTRMSKSLCVAGTHGKTTTSTLLAHIVHNSSLGCSAFLGGISNNYNTNLLIDTKSEYVVAEADEYDRSFHHLSPYMSVITSMDADHLDIYGTEECYHASFVHYASLVSNSLVVKYGLSIPESNLKAKVYTYSVEDMEADFTARNIRFEAGVIVFDFYTPNSVISNIRLCVPAWVNVENCIAALAVAYLLGLTEQELRDGVSSFTGVYRRFNVHINNGKVCYIDDYAHHPEELKASIHSVKMLYPDRKVIVTFQPHLYSRTHDFAEGFAQSLSMADTLLLLPIYPARELPMPGVTSEWLLTMMPPLMDAKVVQKSELVKQVSDSVAKCLSDSKSVVVMTLGAGDIDRLVGDIKQNLNIYE